MVIIKKQKNKAYILVEGLVALATLVTICSLLLTAIDTGRYQQLKGLEQQEVFNVAQMAVQTGQSNLSLNGVRVTVERSVNYIRVYHEGQEVLYVAKN